MIKFQWINFHDLSSAQLYDALALRSEVFVVEQKIIYLDVDGRDDKAIHLLGYDHGCLVAYLRLFTANPIVFGRVVTSPKYRKNGYGKLLIKEMLSYCDKNFPGVRIECSAQYYLLRFYESFGFKAEGETYVEEEIPHIAMYK